MTTECNQNNNEETFIDLMATRIKFTLIGEKEVGKTTIIKNFLKELPNTDKGINSYKAKFERNKETFIFKLIDTPSEERFLQFIKSEYDTTNFALIIFDITNKESFLSVNKWINHVRSSDNKDIELILIGNKKDLEKNRQVSKEEAIELAEKQKMKYYEISALKEEEIDPIFKTAFNEFLEKLKTEDEDKDNAENARLTLVNNSKNINKNFDEKKKNCCC